MFVWLFLVAPTKADKQRKYWEAEEARLAAEESELDRTEQEFGMQRYVICSFGALEDSLVEVWSVIEWLTLTDNLQQVIYQGSVLTKR